MSDNPFAPGAGPDSSITWLGTQPPMSPSDAAQKLYSMTGVPDIISGISALRRGEILPGIGQAGFGALQAGSLFAPTAKFGPALREGLEAVPRLMGDEVGAIRGFHGTPHTFAPEPGAPLGRFRDEAIGSGEGAQAYGYGHYVAGNQGVAKSYQTGGDSIFFMNGKKFDVEDLDNFPADQSFGIGALLAKRGNLADALSSLINHVEEYRTLANKENDPKMYEEIINNHLKGFDWLEKNHDQIKLPTGNLLEIHILPEEHELLDWDRPLSQQSPGVQQSLSRSGLSRDMLPDWPGSEIYKEISRNLEKGKSSEYYTRYETNPDKEASKALHEAGIPGLRYLDAGSRAAGNGTHNYVIFHPDNLRIIGRNGERLEPVDHDPFAAEPQ